MTEKDDAPARLRVEFSRARDCPTYAVTGVWGGLSPNGVVVARPYVETYADPEAIDHEVSGDGKLDDGVRTGETGEDGAIRTRRVFQCELVLPGHVARTFGKWLIEKADALDLAEAKLDPEDSH